MATAIYYHVSSGHKQDEPHFLDIFSEEKYPITVCNICCILVAANLFPGQTARLSISTTNQRNTKVYHNNFPG